MAVDEQVHSDEVDFGLDDDFEPDADETKSRSVIEALKAQHARVAEERTLDVAVPGWANMLVLRLGPISAGAQARIVEKVSRRKLSTHASNVDFLVAAFRGIYGRTRPDDRELTHVVDENGEPMGLDERLAEAINLGEVHSAREVVERLFSRANSPTFALDAVVSEWGEWARDASEEVDEDFLGESPAATP